MTKPAMEAPRIGIVGWKNSGKTTLAAALIAELTARDLVVASVKSAHHDFQIDDPKTDSGKHATAGAAQTAILGSARWAIMGNDKDAEPLTLDDILARMSPCDVIVIEGFKNSTHPKIEVRGDRDDRSTLADTDPAIIAIASDAQIETSLPVFRRDAITELSDFAVGKLGVLI
ncbi:MAG: molybdopterin-guanine dinucleotide biosynthesis protein B [Pseudomonadota bacterium]